MKHASVFSGIGGPEVAASMLGWENVFHCEINPFGKRVLDYWYPNSDSYDDITKTSFKKYRGTIDVLTGGFPCQPFSYAGKRKGADDDRYLWPEMLRVIGEVRPTWFVGENVSGIRTMVEPGSITDLGGQSTIFDEGEHLYESVGVFTIERICENLESAGYSVQPMLIPACAVGAPHRRDRIFFIAHANCCANLREPRKNEGEGREERIQEWDKVREFDKSSGVRGTFENPLCCGFVDGRNAEQGSERNERNAGARNNKRLRGKADARDIAHTESKPSERGQFGKRETRIEGQGEFGRSDCKTASDTNRNGLQRPLHGGSDEEESWAERPFEVTPAALGYLQKGDAWRHFPTISPVHRGNDGIPFDVDCLSLPFTKWREETIKAYGNAIVPQVMYEIFRAIETIESEF